MESTYDKKFFKLNLRSAFGSAQTILPIVQKHLGPQSVLDVGCGSGAWLSVWKDLGVEVLGLDGDYVDPTFLAIDPQEFRATDLNQSFDLNKKFDLVQCLEVAEHIPKENAEKLVQSITRHSTQVLFSAAPPGQGGIMHVNEQPYSYWRNIFLEFDFELYDFIRPQIENHPEVSSWYRYNLMFFAHKDSPPKSPDISRFKVKPNHPVEDVSPLKYKIRKGLLRQLPTSLTTYIFTQRQKSKMKDA